MRRWLGLDWADLLLHAGITVAVGATLTEFVSPDNQEAALGVVATVSLLVLAWRRKRAWVRGAVEQAAGDRVVELESRVMELEAAQLRILELEERLDFTERMLVQQRESARLPDGSEAR